MFIITRKEDDEILMMGAELDYMENGYPRIVDYDVAFFPEYINVSEAGKVLEGVEVHKYCYTPEDGFYLNPNYREANQYGIPDELVERIKNDAITEVEEAVINADE